MNSTLIYSFRTNKYINYLNKAGIEVFVFGKLKEDFIKFQKLVERTRPELIIGLAEVKDKSKFETLAINIFGRDRKVNKNGKNSYPLHIPYKGIFQKSANSTKSFCNWTMYKISEIIDPKYTKVSFLHFNKKDLSEVFDFIKNMK